MIDSIAHLLISPTNQCILGLIFSALVFKCFNVGKWVYKSIAIVSIGWYLLCSQYFFSYLLIAPLENQFPPIQSNSPKWQKADLIWVLACYHYEAESLPMVSQFNQCSVERLVQASNMYRVKKTPVYLTGSDFNEESELQHASQAALFLEELGVDPNDIHIINEGKNTATEAKQLLNEMTDTQPTVAVISSATHALRLSKILNNSPIEYIIIPVHYSTHGDIVYKLNTPSTSSLLRSERAFYEYAALTKQWIMGSSTE